MKTETAASISIILSRQTGSLERLLGRIRRRGFTVEGMMVNNSSLVDGYRIEMRVGGERSFQTLAKHLANLEEVLQVSLQTAESIVDFRSQTFTPAPVTVPVAATW